MIKNQNSPNKLQNTATELDWFCEVEQRCCREKNGNYYWEELNGDLLIYQCNAMLKQKWTNSAHCHTLQWQASIFEIWWCFCNFRMFRCVRVEQFRKCLNWMALKFLFIPLFFTIEKKKRKRISWRIGNTRDIFYENLWRITCAIHSYFQADQTELIPTEYSVEFFEIVFIRNKFQC